MQVDRVAIDTLVLDPANVRKHDCERFFAMVARAPSGCWDFAVVQPRTGYGKFFAERVTWRAHRPTMKPVELVEYCLGNSSKRGDDILDPFGGSGTTMIAAERLGRTAFLLELDPRYCDVIVARWEAFTGKTAQLQSLEDAHGS